MAMADIEDELTCPVCLELYKDPRLLPCHHSFCKSCLLGILSKKEYGELQCPSCRHSFSAQNEMDIESLPNNFTLASIVTKFRNSTKEKITFHPCDICEEVHQRKAVKKCLNCQLNYCSICLEQLHPKKGALAHHKFLHLMDVYTEIDEKTNTSATVRQSDPHESNDQNRGKRYCISCDKIYTEGNQSSAKEKHERHDTTDLQTASKNKREEIEHTLEYLHGAKQDMEMASSEVSSRLQAMKKRVSLTILETAKRFEELTENIARKKISLEKKIDQEFKMNIDRQERKLCEIKEEIDKLQAKISDLSELSNITDACIFMERYSNVQNEKAYMANQECILNSALMTESENSLFLEQIDTIIAEAAESYALSNPRREVEDKMDGGKKLFLDSVTKEGKEALLTKKIEAIRKKNQMLQQRHEEIQANYRKAEKPNKYVASSQKEVKPLPGEEKYADPCLESICISPKPVDMKITVTNDKKAGAINLEWLTRQKANHYEVSYFCDPDETIVRKNIVENSCRLTNLLWGSDYTFIVTAYLPAGKTFFDSAVFKSDPGMKYQTHVDTIKSQKRVHMAITVTSIQKAGMMSADVEWSATDQAEHYEVTYFCDPGESIVRKNIVENSSKLTNLRWESTYTVTVTAFLPHAKTYFDSTIFNTDPEVKCYPMTVTEVCNKKIEVSTPFTGFIASKKVKSGVVYTKVGQFSGVTFTPLLTEERQFWTMKVDLSLFELGDIGDIFLDFGIIAYDDLEYTFGLYNNRESYSCSVFQKSQEKVHLKFQNCTVREGNTIKLPLKLYKKTSFCYGFMYDDINSLFAILDCESQRILHVFRDVDMSDDPIFAVCPYHTEVKMRAEIMMDHEDCLNEDISYWMRKINAR